MIDPQDFSRRVGQLLRTLRQQRRWSLETAVLHLGCTPSTIGAYERDDRHFDMKMFAQLLNGYGVTPVEFFAMLEDATEEPTREESPYLKAMRLNRTIRKAQEDIRKANDELELLIDEAITPDKGA